MKAYLLVYNCVCGAMWAYCVAQTVRHLLAGSGVQLMYDSFGRVMVCAQTAMMLEILHSLIGLVPSPLPVVATQVLGRVFIVWGHLYWVTACQQHWSLVMLVLSWGTAEIVRYAFYVCTLLGHVPYPLFYLRYTMFVVLYPTGITAELFQALVGMGAHWQMANPLWYRLCVLALMLYIPGSPGMIGNMWRTRRRSFKKRDAPAVVLRGVCWPLTKKGDRSSTATNRAILAAAAQAGPGGERAAERVLDEKNWRFGYPRHIREHVEQCLESEGACIAMAKAGLAAAQATFTFIREGHEEISIGDAMERLGKEGFDTAEFVGVGLKGERQELSLQYGAVSGKPYHQFATLRKQRIRGLRLREQLDQWVAYGTMEQDVADALKVLQGHQVEWLDLAGMHFVLLGAASAMGPLRFLLEHGATVIAVARPNTLPGILREAQDLPGKVLFPVRRGSDWNTMAEKRDIDGLARVGGCDLMTQTPEIANWLVGIAPGQALTLGNYTYLDGPLHVQIAVACDSIMERVCAARKDTAVAFLCTPTDAHVVTKEAAEVARTAHLLAPAWAKALEAAGVLKPNRPIGKADGIQFMDAVLVDQGPNYILAKRVQHWRALVARSNGHVASNNVSPSSATASVTSNASFAACFGGMHIFKPIEIAYQELSSSLMGALLVHDLRNKRSAAQPSTKLPHPLCLTQATSFHGGLWRCPFTIATIGIPSAVAFYVAKYWEVMLLAAGAFACAAQYAVVGALPGPFGSAQQAFAAPPFLRQLATAMSVPI